MSRTHTRRRLLVADDNDSARLLLADHLRLLGHEVVEVGHGLAAVDACRVGRFDLILMDCQMPVLDGLDATRALRAELTYHPVIVAITADDNCPDCLDAGMDDYLRKPFRPHQLREVLARWLGEEVDDRGGGVEVEPVTGVGDDVDVGRRRDQSGSIVG